MVHHVTHHAMLFSGCQNIAICTDHVVMLGSSSFLGIVRDRGEWFMVYWEILLLSGALTFLRSVKSSAFRV